MLAPILSNMTCFCAVANVAITDVYSTGPNEVVVRAMVSGCPCIQCDITTQLKVQVVAKAVPGCYALRFCLGGKSRPNIVKICSNQPIKLTGPGQ